MLLAELLKLRRSAAWIVVVALPASAIITGTVNLLNNREQLSHGWESLTSQAVLFYGLLFFSMGVGLLSAAVWRAEQRGTNMNLLFTSSRPFSQIILSKIVVIIILVTIMQGIFVVGTLVSGLVFLRLSGSPPVSFYLACSLAIPLTIPLAILQSMLSMVIRSFVVPIALCLLGCVPAIASVTSTSLKALSGWIPQAINVRTLNLGSMAIAGSGDVRPADILGLAAPAMLLSALLLVAHYLAVTSIKIR